MDIHSTTSFSFLWATSSSSGRTIGAMMFSKISILALVVGLHSAAFSTSAQMTQSSYGLPNSQPISTFPNGVPNFGVPIPEAVVEVVNRSLEYIKGHGFYAGGVDPQSLAEDAISAYSENPDGTDPNAVIAYALNEAEKAGAELGNLAEFVSTSRFTGFPNLRSPFARYPMYFSTGLPNYGPSNIFDVSQQLYYFPDLVDTPPFIRDFSKFFNGTEFPGLGFPFPAIRSKIPADVMNAINSEIGKFQKGYEIDPQPVVDAAVEANRQSSSPMAENDAIAAALNAAHGAGAVVESNVEKYFPNGMDGVRATLNNGASAIRSSFDAFIEALPAYYDRWWATPLTAAVDLVTVKFGRDIGPAVSCRAESGPNL